MIISLDEKRYNKSASWMFMWLVPLLSSRCRHGHDHMVVGFTTTYAIPMPITTNVSSNPNCNNNAKFFP